MSETGTEGTAGDLVLRFGMGSGGDSPDILESDELCIRTDQQEYGCCPFHFSFLKVSNISSRKHNEWNRGVVKVLPRVEPTLGR